MATDAGTLDAGSLDTGTLLRVFDVHDTDWLTPLEGKQKSADPLSGSQTPYVTNIRGASLLVDPPDRLSLYGVAFEPGFYIPTHSGTGNAHTRT